MPSQFPLNSSLCALTRPCAGLLRPLAVLVQCATLAACGVAHFVAPEGSSSTVWWAGGLTFLCALLVAAWAYHCYNRRSMLAFGMLGQMVLQLAATSCVLLRQCVGTPFPHNDPSIGMTVMMCTALITTGKLAFHVFHGSLVASAGWPASLT